MQLQTAAPKAKQLLRLSSRVGLIRLQQQAQG
jgi:hypothetical protein